MVVVVVGVVTVVVLVLLVVGKRVVEGVLELDLYLKNVVLVLGMCVENLFAEGLYVV